MNVLGLPENYNQVSGEGNFRASNNELDVGTRNDEDLVFIRNDVEVAEFNANGDFEVKGDLIVDGKIVAPS